MSGLGSARVLLSALHLVDAVETAAGHDVDVLHARAAQDACVLVVATREDGERLAELLGAVERRRFGWQRPGARSALIVEVEGRPELHPPTASGVARA